MTEIEVKWLRTLREIGPATAKAVIEHADTPEEGVLFGWFAKRWPKMVGRDDSEPRRLMHYVITVEGVLFLDHLDRVINFIKAYGLEGTLRYTFDEEMVSKRAKCR